ncbi:hypothetical protein SLS63_009469 [Diaporthe eres]|uniref:Uncharacterized protein n=1 Tax=Diaporthe eres TaxID=83184 RepID=A0ABR1P006_DIAER
MGQCHSSHRAKPTSEFDPASDEISEAAKQKKIRDVYNQLETNGIRILQTGKTESVALDTDEGELALRDIWTSGACQSVSAARQAIFLELEHRHPYLHYKKPVAAAVSPSLDGFEYRFYTKNYKDNDALVAYIVDRRKNPPRSSYSTMLVDMVVAEMSSVTPPAVSGPAMTGITAANDILDANEPYVVAVVAAYDEAVKTTDGKTETQLGLAADHVSYR